MFYHLDNKPLKKALIIHSGALGDCVLTLKLAKFLRDTLNVKIVNFIGQSDYISFMPGRTSIDGIRNINSIRLDKLFSNPRELEVEEDDPLVKIFGGYDWIISFLGGTGSNFETNLAYLACFTSSPEIVMLSARTHETYEKHISEFHVEELISMKRPSIEAMGVNDPHKLIPQTTSLICPNINDVQQGLSILKNRLNLSHTKDNVAVISPGSGGREKCWHIDNYIETSQRLRKEGLEPLFLLGEVERERFDKTTISKLTDNGNVISSLSIEQVVGLLSVAKLYIGNDSGVSHVSGAMELPTISIFGPTNPQTYKPIGTLSKSLRFGTEAFGGYDEKSVGKVIRTIFETINTKPAPLFDIHI